MIGENVPNAKAILQEIKNDLLDQLKPHKFNENDPKSIIHKREESFERLCFQLRKNNIPSPDTLSTYSFYSSIQLIKEEIEAKNKQVQ